MRIEPPGRCFFLKRSGHESLGSLSKMPEVVSDRARNALHIKNKDVAVPALSVLPVLHCLLPP